MDSIVSDGSVSPGKPGAGRWSEYRRKTDAGIGSEHRWNTDTGIGSEHRWNTDTGNSSGYRRLRNDSKKPYGVHEG